MSTESTTTDATAPALYRDLLSAIRDALDVPRPDDAADEYKFEVLQRERVITAVGTIDAVLVEGLSPEIMTGVLRDLVQENPVTYRPYAPEAQDSPAEEGQR